MKLQNISLPMMSNNYTHVGKDAKSKNSVHMDNAAKNGKAGNPNAVNVSLSSHSQFDKMIENIQEQIQKIQENDHYDADTKKSKIEELEKQLEEIEKTKSGQLAESTLGQKKKFENNSYNENTNNNSKEKSNSSGVILDLTIDAKALIQADKSLKNLKNAHSIKVKLEGESNILASEIKIDKGRGVDTTKKEEQFARLKEGVENAFANMGEAIQDVNKAAQDMFEGTTLSVETCVDEKEKSAE